jgi:hypothetical protein
MKETPTKNKKKSKLKRGGGQQLVCLFGVSIPKGERYFC